MDPSVSKLAEPGSNLLYDLADLGSSSDEDEDEDEARD